MDRGRRRWHDRLCAGICVEMMTVTIVMTMASSLLPCWPSEIAQWEPHILNNAARYRLDPDLVAAIVAVESHGDASLVSGMGAVGLMQVMPRGGAWWTGDRPSAEELVDPRTNLAWGCRILARCLRVAGHTWGPRGGVACYYGLEKPFTAAYVTAVSKRYNDAKRCHHHLRECR